MPAEGGSTTGGHPYKTREAQAGDAITAIHLQPNLTHSGISEERTGAAVGIMQALTLDQCSGSPLGC